MLVRHPSSSHPNPCRLIGWSSYSNLSITADCIIDNTAYTAYGQSGSAYAFVISRDKYASPLFSTAAS